MLVTLMPGGDRERLLQDLDVLRGQLSNITFAPNVPIVETYVAYVRWVTNAERQLRHQVQASDVEFLVAMSGLTQLSLAVGPAQVSLLAAEIERRRAAFDSTHAALKAQIDRWRDTEGWLVVMDANVYLHGPDPLAALDVIGLMNSASGSAEMAADATLHVLLPIVVVDELDKGKQASKAKTRWRARHTLQVLDKVFVDSATVARWRPNITMEMVLDPRGHVRLPIPDDEIIDRVVAISGLAGRPVTMLTYDTGMATRSRMAGLRTLNLSDPPDGDEPEDEPRKDRRDRRDQQCQGATAKGDSGQKL